MSSTPDALFARYVRTKDPDALAQVFDATAPRLLRLAIHLASDAAEAEDLVQATFLAAIERAGEFDLEREVLPWLLGILANKAKLRRRESSRVLDATRLAARLAEDPAETAAQSEWSGELARALDRLAEPYRSVLVLHLRHGLAPADVAHVLERSPGSVRVQIHRGKELLRRELPQGFAFTGVLALVPTPGLDAVRATVLAEARAVFLASAGGALLGGVLVTKKLLALAALVAALLATWRLWPENASPVAPAVAVPSSTHELDAPSSSTLTADAGDAAERTPAAAPGDAASAAQTISGRVFDGETDEPIAGALVRVFGSRPTTVDEFKRARFDLIEQTAVGTVGSRLPVPSTQDREDQDSYSSSIRVFDLPRADEPGLAMARTNADGSFSLNAPVSSLALICEAQSYGPLRARLHDARTLEIRLLPERWVRGYVRDVEGEPLHERLKLLFHSNSSFNVSHTGEAKLEDLGAFALVETNEDGSFEFQIAAEQVQARSRTPEWYLTDVGWNPETEQRWVYESSDSTSVSQGPFVLIAHRAPVLRVQDAATGAAIESFFLRGVSAASGEDLWTGEFYAPSGCLSLLQEEPWDVGRFQGLLRLDVWADGYRASSVEVTDLLERESIQVGLEPGTEGEARGTVVDAAGPVPGASVRLLTRGAHWWREVSARLVEQTSTDRDGGFVLHAPPGAYIVLVETGPVRAVRALDLPPAEPLLIDLDLLASVTVEVRDANGIPQGDHAVALSDSTGRQLSARTGDDGRASFEALWAGTYRAHVPDVAPPENTSWSGGQVLDLELSERESRRVDVVLPDRGESRFARLVVVGSESVEGWRVRRAFFGGDEWLPVDPDGRIPIDLRDDPHYFGIQHPDGRMWRVPVTLALPEGHEIRIDPDAPAVRGRLLDDESKPMGDVHVWIGHPYSPSTSENFSPSMHTRADGSFDLACCDQEDHQLHFEREQYFGNGIGSFALGRRLSETHLEIVVRLPRRDEAGALEGSTPLRIRGLLISRADGTPRMGVWIRADLVIRQDDGELLISVEQASCVTDAEGRFDLVTSFAEQIELSYFAEQEKRLYRDRWSPPTGQEIVTRDLFVE